MLLDAMNRDAKAGVAPPKSRNRGLVGHAHLRSGPVAKVRRHEVRGFFLRL